MIPGSLSTMPVDISAWSGEGEFTRTLVDVLARLEGVVFLRVEDAPASRTEGGYCFISNEVYVGFRTSVRRDRTRRLRIPTFKRLTEKAMTLGDLEAVLTLDETIGAPDYSDDGMLQYLRTERIIAPYQTTGYKLVEMVRIYDASATGIPRTTRRHRDAPSG
ncbi:MAG: hypothetical protein AB1806_10095 [Acidobacteriota bacterium]